MITSITLWGFRPMRIAFKTLPPSLGFLVVVLSSCHAPSAENREENIDFTLINGIAGMGLSLRVRNLTSATVCLPIPPLTGNSGSVRATLDGKEFASPENTEYPGTISGSGPFYMVSKKSTAIIPVDEGGLKLKSGRYLFSIRPAWMPCDLIDSAKSYPSGRFKTKLVRSSVMYQPFE